MPLIFIILTLFFTDSEPAKPEMKPPGTVIVGDLYFDITETLNIHWTHYLRHLNIKLDSSQVQLYKTGEPEIRNKEEKRAVEISRESYLIQMDDIQNSELMQPYLPDSLNFWYSYPSRRFQPITYISYEQAIDYCAWRSKVVSNKYGRKVVYRLPTNEEWNTVARYLLDNQYKATIKDFKQMEEFIESNEKEYTLMVINGFKSDIIHMFGNVSEMTADKGIAKGANNNKLIEPEENITKVYHYDRPNAYLGFRCVAEYVE